MQHCQLVRQISHAIFLCLYGLGYVHMLRMIIILRLFHFLTQYNIFISAFYTARSAGQKGCVNMPLLGSGWGWGGDGQKF